MSGTSIVGLSLDRLRTALSYNKESGEFRWCEKRNRNTVVGSVAGCKNSQGYWWIALDGKRYLAHRLAWLYVHGRIPTGEIDHINGCRTDNRIVNLRDTSRQVNARNRICANPKNSTGLLGVSVDRGRFRSRIVADGLVVNLGMHDTPEAAHEAYLAAKRRHHPEFRTG